MCSVLIYTLLALAIVHHCDGFEIRGVFHKIMHPFSSNDNSQNNVNPREHGNFDFFGRDIIKYATTKVKSLADTIRRPFSKITEGLDCNRTLFSGVSSFKSRIRAIYPGTKWCGDGDISKTYNDLGKFSTTDHCCREHDLCPDNMAADSTRRGLTNSGIFTRSHCDCDRKFYNCLKRAKSIVANSIGYTYFTILGPQCFKEDYPVVRCLRKRLGKCIKYSTDTNGEKTYQWFDSPQSTILNDV